MVLDLNVASPRESSSCGANGAADSGSASSSSSVLIIADVAGSPEIVTRQLFPVGAPSSATSATSAAPPPPPPRWPDLTAPAPAQQQQQRQMKKSRRGPRSRSSQYRGVTFYRRTGRWESHIWLEFRRSDGCVFASLHFSSFCYSSLVYFTINYWDDFEPFLVKCWCPSGREVLLLFWGLGMWNLFSTTSKLRVKELGRESDVVSQVKQMMKWSDVSDWFLIFWGCLVYLLYWVVVYQIP